MKEILSKRYSGLSEIDINCVFEKIKKREADVSSAVENVGWKREIISRAVDFLEASNVLSVDGFINFRLQDFREELEMAVEDAIEEYILEKEYDEFIKLLRYFVDTQEPGMRKMHILFTQSGGFSLYDNNFCPIDSEYLEEFMFDFAESDMTCEDMLVSMLITVAPMEIVIHLPACTNEMASIVDTIQNIFGERASLCIGCSRCISYTRKEL